MGTLFEQTPRSFRDVETTHIAIELDILIHLSKEYGVSLSDVIKVAQLLQYQRRTDCLLNNGDIHDEQMAGFGLLIKELINTLKELND